MEQKQVSRRGFFRGTVTVAGAAAAALSLEEQHLVAFQQGGAPAGAAAEGRPAGGRREQVVIPSIPGPVPTMKLGGIEVSRLIAGHNIMMGQAHEGGSGLVYVSSLVRNYFTQEKIMETLAAYEENGITCAGARMAQNMADIMKAWNAQGGKLKWMAACSSERDIPMAVDTESVLGYVHGNMSDRAIRSEDGVEQIATLMEQMEEAGMRTGVCCHTLDVPIALEEAGVKPAFYVKTINPVNYSLSGGSIPESSGENEAEQAEQAAQITADFMAKVDVPWIGFKVLGAGRVTPSNAFEAVTKMGCDGMLIGMYDFQVADNANLCKQIYQGKDDLERSRPWYES